MNIRLGFLNTTHGSPITALEVLVAVWKKELFDIKTKSARQIRAIKKALCLQKEIEKRPNLLLVGVQIAIRNGY